MHDRVSACAVHARAPRRDQQPQAPRDRQVGEVPDDGTDPGPPTTGSPPPVRQESPTGRQDGAANKRITDAPGIQDAGQDPGGVGGDDSEQAS